MKVAWNLLLAMLWPNVETSCSGDCYSSLIDFHDQGGGGKKGGDAGGEEEREQPVYLFAHGGENVMPCPYS